MKKNKINYFGFSVEVILEPLPDINVDDNSIPCTVQDLFSEKIEHGERSGTFRDMPDDGMEFGSGNGFTRSGSWRVIEFDYKKISRILEWERNFSRDEQLSKELFIRFYGSNMGHHYYDKWLFYKRRVFDMLAYYGTNSSDGQLFCDMVMEQIHKFEKRTKKIRL